MATLSGLKQLHERKRELLLESELNRQVLALEYEQIRLRTEQWRGGFGPFRLGWKWVAPVAGFLLGRKFKKAGGLVTGGSVGWVVLRELWDWWQNGRTREARANPPRVPAP